MGRIASLGVQQGRVWTGLAAAGIDGPEELRTRARVSGDRGGPSRLTGNVLYWEAIAFRTWMIADTESEAHADDAADAGAARTFRVRAENLPALRERIERIDRRARRLGTGPVLL